jgi:hypothetical protein
MGKVKEFINNDELFRLVTGILFTLIGLTNIYYHTLQIGSGTVTTVGILFILKRIVNVFKKSDYNDSNKIKDFINNGELFKLLSGILFILIGQGNISHHKFELGSVTLIIVGILFILKRFVNVFKKSDYNDSSRIKEFINDGELFSLLTGILFTMNGIINIGYHGLGIGYGLGIVTIVGTLIILKSIVDIFKEK